MFYVMLWNEKTNLLKTNAKRIEDKLLHMHEIYNGVQPDIWRTIQQFQHLITPINWPYKCTYKHLILEVKLYYILTSFYKLQVDTFAVCLDHRI